MYVTRETEVVLLVLAASARRPGRSFALWEIAESGFGNTEEIAKSVSLLLRHGLLKDVSDGRMVLVSDPAAVTLGSILRITQPDLVRSGRRNMRHRRNNVLTLSLEAASSNFLRIADQFTVADFTENPSFKGRHAAQ